METLMQKLESLAWKTSIAFCYGCYVSAPAGKCTKCQSDDLMRLVPGVGVEYGIEWVINHLIESNVIAANVNEAFEQSVRECYPEVVEVGWLKLDTVDTIKNSDPISWDLAKSEWIDGQLDDGLLVKFRNCESYFWISEIENFVERSADISEKPIKLVSQK